MLTLLVGTPGSGKTLYAIDKIIKINSNEAKEFEHIEYIYNNISGFKFEKYFDSKIKNEKLNFDKLYIHLKLLFSIFTQNQNSDNLDNLLIEYCKTNNIYNSYFIIDEAHNYFDNQDKVKNWWFTYHRHLHHEILLITQNKSLINTQYRNIPELFIQAQARSKAISKNVLRYFNYTDYRMTQKFSITEIKADKTYFDLYTSGNKSKQRLVGFKYLILFGFALVFLIFIIAYLIYNFFFTDPFSNLSNVSSLQNNQTQNKTTKEFEQNEHFPNKNLKSQNQKIEISKKMFKFTCFSTNCYIKIDNKLEFIPYEILRTYSLTGENIHIEKKSKRLNVFLLLPEDTFNFLNKGVRNENNFNKGFINDGSFSPNFESGKPRD